MTCPICLRPRTLHDPCFAAALQWVIHGKYDAPVEHHLARQLAPTCYLCGTAPTTQAEHVEPRHHGGADTWGNVGGACQPCNRHKWHRPTVLTPQQRERWASQQAAYRAAYDRVTPDLVAAALATRAASQLTLQSEDPLEYLVEAIEDELPAWTDLPVEVAASGSQVVVTFQTGGTIRVEQTSFFLDHPG